MLLLQSQTRKPSSHWLEILYAQRRHIIMGMTWQGSPCTPQLRMHFETCHSDINPPQWEGRERTSTAAGRLSSVIFR